VERGALVSDHPYPRPLLRRITAVLVALGLFGIVFGVIGLLVLAVALALPLLPLMAVFLAGMALPLVQLAVLHPHITVYERGLWLQPLLGRRVWVPWEHVVDVTDHTLIRRGTRKEREKEHFGQLIVVDRGLPWPFAVVGGMAGLGFRTRAFGISTYSHTDYNKLRSAIQRHKAR
jgi:hypothetical protein